VVVAAMKLLTGLGIMAIVGLAVGIALFSLTSGHLGTLQTISPPPCPQVNADPTAFDPLTGLPYGYTFVCGGGGWIHQPLAAQQAIPVPLGFLLGAAAAGLVLLFDVGRRRRAVSSRPIE
jgi:hypothetical protein